jgi:hypothetical protein
MASSPFSISCMLCSQPVDLQRDLQTDETGKAVHEDCYFNHVTPKQRDGGQKLLGMAPLPLALLCSENASSRLRGLAYGRR